MKLRQIILGMIALLITAAAVGQAAAQEKKEEKDQVLKMSQVSQKVQQTINTYATANEIKKITLGDADGTPAYEFEIEKAGRKSEVSITRDGKLLSTEEDMPLSEIPEAARKVINTQATGGKVVSTEKAFENGKTSYEAVVEKSGKRSEVSVTADGKIVGSEEDIALSEVPEAARKTINSQAVGGKILSTKKVLEDGKTNFEVIIEKGGKQKEITVSAAGKVVDTETIKH